MLYHFERKAAVHILHPQPAARKRISDRGRKGFIVSDLVNRLNGCRQISSVIAENGSARPYLRRARRTIGIRSEVVVKAPGSNRVPER